MSDRSTFKLARFLSLFVSSLREHAVFGSLVALAVSALCVLWAGGFAFLVQAVSVQQHVEGLGLSPKLAVSLWSAVGALPYAFLYTMGLAVVSGRVAHAYQGRKLGLGELLRRGSALVPLSLVLTALSFAAGLLINVAILNFGQELVGQSGLFFVVWALGACFGVMCWVQGMIMVPLMMTQKLSFGQAFSAASALLRGHRGRISLTVLLFSLLLGLLLALPLVVMVGVMVMVGDMRANEVVMMAVILGTAVFGGALVTMLNMIFSGVTFCLCRWELGDEDSEASEEFGADARFRSFE